MAEVSTVPKPHEARSDSQKPGLRTKIAENPAAKKITSWIDRAMSRGKPVKEILQELATGKVDDTEELPLTDTPKIREQKEEENKQEKVAPSISEFPEKVRPRIQELFDKAKVHVDKIMHGIQTAKSIQLEAQGSQQTIEEIKLQLETTTQEERDLVDHSIANLTSELGFLQKAYAMLEAGKDIPELRTESNGIVSFTKEELDLFANTSNPLQKLRQIAGRAFPSYQKRRETYLKKLKTSYDIRVSRHWSSLRNQIVAGNEIAETPWDEVSNDNEFDSFKNALDTTMDNAHKLARKIAAKDYGLKAMEKWLQENTSNLLEAALQPDIHPLNSILTAKDESKTSFEQTKDDFVSKLSSYPSKQSDIVQQRLHKALVSEAMTLRDERSPVRGQKYQNAWISQDAVGLYRSVTDAIDKSGEEESMVINDDIELVNKTLKALTDVAKEHFQEGKQIASSQEMLWHTATIPVIKEMLQRGFIASRQFQIDHFGEAQFHKIRVGKDYVDAEDPFQPEKTRRYTLEEYRKKIRGSPNKDPMQEAHQICFSEEGVYNPNLYGEGVAFGFSKADLFQKTQFMEIDGWHLFDKDFSHQDPNAPGFAVDLRREPMIIATDSPSRQQEIIDYFRSTLAASPVWQETFANVDSWLETHVVCTPDLFSEGPESDAAIAALRNQFFQRYQFQVHEGTIIPTGELGEGSRTLEDLYVYQPIAV